MTAEETIKSGGKNGLRPPIAFWLFLLIMIGAVLRVNHAGMFYYNSDEAMHAAIASGASLREVLRFAHFEIHPPLLYLLAHYWGMLSTVPAFMRGLPLIFGLSLIPLYFAIGKKLGGIQLGLACAALITFSHGCIIQSYVLRQYMPFLFFLSLALLALLFWRESHHSRHLSAYALCGILACCTHFSGIFAVTAMTAFEAWRMLRASAPIRRMACWLAANALIAAPACLLYRNWQPVIKPLREYFKEGQPTFPDAVRLALSYPLEEIAYILPGGGMTLAGIVVTAIAIAFFRPTNNEKPVNKKYKELLLLGFFALLFGAALYAARIYPVSGTRRNLWLLPFVVPPLGWAAAAFSRSCLRLLKQESLNASTGLLVVAGLMFYSPAKRFADGSEYVWQQAVWDDFHLAMQKWGPRDLIVTEKDDGIMLANLYSAMGQDALSGNTMLATQSYGQTHILFNPYYPRNYTAAIFLKSLEQAEREYRLDGMEHIVFLRMAWSHSPLTDLMTCPNMKKKVRTFPDFGADPSRDDIERARAAILITTPDSIREAILSPAGKGRTCLGIGNMQASHE